MELKEATVFEILSELQKRKLNGELFVEVQKDRGMCVLTPMGQTGTKLGFCFFSDK